MFIFYFFVFFMFWYDFELIGIWVQVPSLPFLVWVRLCLLLSLQLIDSAR